MQTFLPSYDFGEVASVLDRQRLNKQALEAWQIMMTNLRLNPAGEHREPKGWRSHPAVLMWRGHEALLLGYIRAMVEEWIGRGYRSTIYGKARATFDRGLELGRIVNTVQEKPQWFFHDELASSHRVALLSKNYEWYSQYGWPEDTGVRPETYEYVWEVP